MFSFSTAAEIFWGFSARISVSKALHSEGCRRVLQKGQAIRQKNLHMHDLIFAISGARSGFCEG